MGLHFSEITKAILSAALFSSLLVLPPAALAQARGDDLAKGVSALSEARYTEAEHYIVRYLAANQRIPSSCTEALGYLCMAVFRQNRYEDVVKLLDDNADIVAGDNSGIFHYWRARAFLELGRIGESAAIIYEALKNPQIAKSGYPRLYRLLGNTFARSSQPFAEPDAYGAFSNANFSASADLSREMAMFRLDNYLDWAESALKFGNKDEAARVLSAQYELSSGVTNSVSAQKGAVHYAKLLIGSGNAKDAEPILTSIAFSKSANDFNRAEAIAVLPSIVGETNLISSLYGTLESLEIPPQYMAEVKMHFGKELAAKTDTLMRSMAVRILSSAVKANTSSPLAPDCQLILADTCLKLGANTNAVAEFRNYIDAFSGTRGKDCLAKAGLASALFELKEFDESALYFCEASALAESPADSVIFLELAGDASFNAAKYSRSAELYKQAAATALASADTGRSFRCRLKSAVATEHTGDLTAALGEFGEIASDPVASNVVRKANLRIANIHERLGNNEEAEAFYGAAISAETDDETSVSARLGRGRTRYRRFKFDSAIYDLEKIPQSYKAESDEAAYIEILSRYGLGQDENAFALAGRFLASRADAVNLPDVMLWTAQYNFNRRQYAAAEKIFFDFAGKFPENKMSGYAILWAADCAFRQSEFSRAAEIIAEVAKLDGDLHVIPEARLLQARSLRELTRYEDALRVLDEIIVEFPADDLVIEALILKGRTLFALAGKDPDGKGYLNAEQAFSLARQRTDIRPDQEIECAYHSARCFEKAGKYDEAVRAYCSDVIFKFAEFTASRVRLSARSAEFFAKSAFNAAALLENRGDTDGAVSILHHLAVSSLPESEKASDEIRRLRKK